MPETREDPEHFFFFFNVHRENQSFESAVMAFVKGANVKKKKK